jgi:hypothetical protein
VIVSGTQKLEIQVKVKAFARAAVDVSERGIASIHLDVWSIMVKFNVMKIITVLQRAHQIYTEVRKTLLWDGDGLGNKACVVVNLALLAGQTSVGLGGDITGKSAPHKPRWNNTTGGKPPRVSDNVKMVKNGFSESKGDNGVEIPCGNISSQA